MTDLIHAPATPTGGAIAVVRLSGPGAKAELQRVFTGRVSHGLISHGTLTDGERIIDDCMAAFFEGPRSYTGEDMAELYIHGSPAVMAAALALLSSRSRPAEPGEFTKRAFLNGRLSLSEAEAVMDLINAGTSRAAQNALEQMSGGVGSRVSGIEDTLTDALSGLAAAMDFPEELEEDVTSGLPEILSGARAGLCALIDSGLVQLREGARVVIAGRPNAGKSALLNALLGRNRAIVTDLPGTTRDILEESADFCGLPVRLMDTAGIREAADAAEAEGVARAEAAIKGADLVLLVFDGGTPLCAEDAELIRATAQAPRIGIIAKSDVPLVLCAAALEQEHGFEFLAVSSVTGDGIDAIKAAAVARIAPNLDSALVTNSRHLAALREADSALADAQSAADMDCMATDMRRALAALGSITGTSVSEAVIDRIFERFCVGK